MTTETIVPCVFTLMLRDFNETVENMPPINTVGDKLIQLRQDVETNIELNVRQKEAIIARIDNYMNGTYGNTKKPEHYEKK